MRDKVNQGMDDGRYYPHVFTCPKCGSKTDRKLYGITEKPRYRNVFRSYCTNCKVYVGPAAVHSK